MVLTSQWLEENYPKEGVYQREFEQISINNKDKKRKKITKLDIGNQNLEGVLDLSDFVQLEELYCHDNQLTQIFLPINGKLKTLNCSNNQLTELNFLTNLNGESLVELHASFNKLTGDISLLNQFSNLKILGLNNNALTGNLSSLQFLKNLKELDISDTGLNEGLEYLPIGLKYFEHSNIIFKEMEDYNHDYQYWRKDYEKWKEIGFASTEINQWIRFGLKLDELTLTHLKNGRWLEEMLQTSDNSNNKIGRIFTSNLAEVLARNISLEEIVSKLEVELQNIKISRYYKKNLTEKILSFIRKKNNWKKISNK